MEFDDVTLPSIMPGNEPDMLESGGIANHHCSFQCFPVQERWVYDTLTHQGGYVWPSAIRQPDPDLLARDAICRFLSNAALFRKQQNQLASWTHYSGALTTPLQVSQMGKENGLYIVLKVVVFVLKTRLNPK